MVCYENGEPYAVSYDFTALELDQQIGGAVFRTDLSIFSVVALVVISKFALAVPGLAQGFNPGERPRSVLDQDSELSEREREENAARMRARFETLRATTVGARPSSTAVVPPGSYAISIATDFELGGYIFKDGYPLLHDNYPGARNIALGRSAMVSLTPYVPDVFSGTNNSALGSYALHNTSSGRNNVANGAYALFTNLYGSSNDAVGAFALYSNTTGDYNTAMGHAAMFLGTGSRNTALGGRALFDASSANGATAVGFYALANGGAFATAVGAYALSSLTSGGGSNVAVGYRSLEKATTTSFNTAVGTRSLSSLTTGGSNVAVGYGGLVNLETGSANISIGDRSGQNIVGDRNIMIQNPGDVGDNHTIRIGDASNTRAFVGGIFGAMSLGGIQVFVNSEGQLGTMTSSRRFKEEIRPMADRSADLMALRPVIFRYTEEVAGDASRPLEFGLIAEEVAEINPELVVYDEDGQPYSVRYSALVPMLVNELQQLRREVEAQREEAALLRDQRRLLDEIVEFNADLVARLRRWEDASVGAPDDGLSGR